MINEKELSLQARSGFAPTAGGGGRGSLRAGEEKGK